MNKLNHTPGPWKANGPSPFHGNLAVSNYDGVIIADVYRPGDDKIIAASDDMLKALIKIYKNMLSGIEPVIDDKEIEKIIESATDMDIEEALS
jgi:hypothetical protein